jgi:hypothetical protein
MRSATLLFFAILIFLVGGAHSQTVTGSIGNGSAAKGAATRGTVVLDIPGGLHVNSNRPASQYAIPRHGPRCPRRPRLVSARAQP